MFGFKSFKYVILALKEIITSYHSCNSTMFVRFYDASKAFDRINHEKLCHKTMLEE